MSENKVLVEMPASPLTRQEIFDIVLEWRKSHKQCVLSNRACLYRSPENDNACFVGAIIPDEIVNKMGEINSIFLRDIVKELIESKVVHEEVTFYFLRDLQLIHDEYGSMSNKQTEELNRFADKYNLVYTL